MKKSIANPETGDWAEHETAYSDGVCVHKPGYKRVFVSGIVGDGDGIAEQTRSALESIQDLMAQFGGEMQDIVRVRIYVNKSHLSDESLEKIHTIRREFFLKEQYPASTLVEVEGLVKENFLIEIDADGIIPDGEWDVETV